MQKPQLIIIINGAGREETKYGGKPRNKYRRECRYSSLGRRQYLYGVRASHGRVLRGLWTMLSFHNRTMRNLGDPNLFQDWIVGQGKTGALRLVRKSDQLIVMLRSMKEVI